MRSALGHVGNTNDKSTLSREIMCGLLPRFLSLGFYVKEFELFFEDNDDGTSKFVSRVENSNLFMSHSELKVKKCHEIDHVDPQQEIIKVA